MLPSTITPKFGSVATPTKAPIFGHTLEEPYFGAKVQTSVGDSVSFGASRFENACARDVKKLLDSQVLQEPVFKNGDNTETLLDLLTKLHQFRDESHQGKLPFYDHQFFNKYYPSREIQALSLNLSLPELLTLDYPSNEIQDTEKYQRLSRGLARLEELKLIYLTESDQILLNFRGRAVVEQSKK